MRIINAAIFSALSLQGCASIVDGSTQTLSLDTKTLGGAQVVGASCKVENDKGAWRTTTPGKVAVQRSSKDLTVSCVRTGFQPIATATQSSTNAMVLGNILVGGLIGVGVDFLITDAAYKYPDQISAPMAPTGFSTNQPIALTPNQISPAPIAAAPATPAPAIASAGASRQLASNQAAFDQYVFKDTPPVPGAGSGGASPPTRRAFKARGATVTPANAEAMMIHVPGGGVILTEVLPGGAAASAGLLANDVILTFNGWPTADVQDVQQQLYQVPGGTAVTATIWRRNQEMVATIRF